MASSILVRDFLKDVSTALLDLSPQFERWTEAELVSAVNDGQRAIAKFLPHSCSRVDVVKLAPGVRQSIEFIPSSRVYAGSGDIYGAQLLGVNCDMGPTGATPGDAIRIVAVDVLDASTPSWRTKTGTKVRQYTYDPRVPKVFNVSPGVASAANVWVEVSLLANPTPLSTAGGIFGMAGSSPIKLSIDDQYIDDLRHYVLARANLKEAEYGGNANMAATYTTLFVNSINAQAQAVSGQNPNLQTLPFAPNSPATAS